MKKAFQTYIFQRFLTEKQLADMLEDYNGSRIHSGREKRVVCDLDREIYKKYKKGAFIPELAREYERSYYWIWKSITLAAQEYNQAKK